METFDLRPEILQKLQADIAQLKEAQARIDAGLLSLQDMIKGLATVTLGTSGRLDRIEALLTSILERR